VQGSALVGGRFLDAGHYTVPDCKGEKCTFSNAGGEQNGVVTMPTALAASSDVYFYSIGADLWRFRDQYNLAIQDTATAYGFGAETGVPLPGEQEGRVPTPEQKQAAHDQNPTAFPFGQWFTGDNVNLAVGQGEMLTTPMQLANAYAAFANGGTVYSPNIASRILDPTTGEGTVSRVDPEIGPRVLRTLSLPPAVRAPILSGLIGAVTSASGTAAPVFSTFPLSQYPLAGKTGTAQTAGKEAQFDTSLFVGFGPVGSPKYVVAAVLEQSGFGAQAAAPVVRRVFESLGGFMPLPDVPPAPPVGVAAPLVVNGLVDDPLLFLGGRLMALADTSTGHPGRSTKTPPPRKHTTSAFVAVRAHQRHGPRHLQRGTGHRRGSRPLLLREASRPVLRRFGSPRDRRRSTTESLREALPVRREQRGAPPGRVAGSR
jgi:penicillin-binding protein 2